MNPIFKRTSIRQYQNKPIESEKIDLLLKAAMAAPSAGNQQPWEFYVITDFHLGILYQQQNSWPDMIKPGFTTFDSTVSTKQWQAPRCLPLLCLNRYQLLFGSL